MLLPSQRHALNNLVLSLAPATFDQLARLPRLVVWDGESDHTIFRDARVNHAFRAWHDEGHRVIKAPFSLAGEHDVCQWQIKRLLKRWPRAPEWALDVIRREVDGQAEYYEQNGFFPFDQEAFHNAATSY